jgi:hypothetical protein
MTCHACGKPIGWWASWFAPESWCDRCEYIFCVHRQCHHGPFQGDLGWTDCSATGGYSMNMRLLGDKGKAE